MATTIRVKGYLCRERDGTWKWEIPVLNLEGTGFASESVAVINMASNVNAVVITGDVVVDLVGASSCAQ